MNIVKIGDKVENETLTCIHCNSIIEYNGNDIHETGSWTRIHVEESVWDGYKYIICPACGKHVIIKNVSKNY